MKQLVLQQQKSKKKTARIMKNSTQTKNSLREILNKKDVAIPKEKIQQKQEIREEEKLIEDNLTIIEGAVDQMLNFDEVKNLLKEGLQEEADQVAQLQADLKQLSDNAFSININNSTNLNVISTSIPDRQTIIALESDDKENTVVELGEERDENSETSRKISSNPESNVPIEKRDFVNNDNIDKDSVATDPKSLTFMQDGKMQQQTIILNQEETSELTAVKDTNLIPSIEGSETQELLSMVQDLKVKIEVDVSGRLNEFGDASWVSLETKMQTVSNAILSAVICKGIFIVLSAFYSFMSLGSLGQPISRIVMIYFFKNFFVIYFHYQLNKLLIAKIDLYHQYKEQLLKQKGLMEKFLSKIMKKIERLKKNKQQKSKRTKESNGEEDTMKNKQNLLLNINKFNGSAIHEKDNKDSRRKSCQDLEEVECNKDKDSEIQQQKQSSINTNDNKSEISNIQSSPEQDSKSFQQQESLQVQPTNISSQNLPASLQQVQINMKKKSQKPQIVLPPIPSEIQIEKLKLNKIMLQLTELCDGKIYLSLNEFKKGLDTDNSNSSMFDTLSKIRSTLLVSQEQLQSLFDLLQFLSLIMTIVAWSYIYKDIPENIPWQFVMIIWLNIAQDNLQILCFSIYVVIIILVVVASTLYSFFEGIISKKLHQRRFKQLCKSLPRLIYKPNQISPQEADNPSNAKECSICLADYMEGEVQIQLPCDAKHCFHEECILSWIKVRKGCPMCRKSIF